MMNVALRKNAKYHFIRCAHACTRRHGVPFCGLCAAFPCAELTAMIPWNARIVAHQQRLAGLYRTEMMKEP